METEIATILPCLFAHNLVFVTNNLKFEISQPLFMVACLFKFGKLSTMKHTASVPGRLNNY